MNDRRKNPLENGDRLRRERAEADRRWARLMEEERAAEGRRQRVTEYSWSLLGPVMQRLFGETDHA